VKSKALNFFTNRREEKHQFAVIGLGRFGRAVCKTLYNLGYEVLGTDLEEKLVAQALAERILVNAVELDSTDSNALKEAGIYEFDTVIVAIGNFLEPSILTTLNLKEAGVKYVVAKASSETHGKLLKKVGADHVVYPENDAGCELAYALTKPGIIERLDLDSDVSIVEILVPPLFDGKTINELELRRRYGVNILAIATADKFLINFDPQQRLCKGMKIVIIGNNIDIQRLPF